MEEVADSAAARVTEFEEGVTGPLRAEAGGAARPSPPDRASCSIRMRGRDGAIRVTCDHAEHVAAPVHWMYAARLSLASEESVWAAAPHLDLALLARVFRAAVDERCGEGGLSPDAPLKDLIGWSWSADDDSGDFMNELDWFEDHFPPAVPMRCASECCKVVELLRDEQRTAAALQRLAWAVATLLPRYRVVGRLACAIAEVDPMTLTVVGERLLLTNHSAAMAVVERQIDRAHFQDSVVNVSRATSTSSE